jgi:hypothetical protein
MPSAIGHLCARCDDGAVTCRPVEPLAAAVVMMADLVSR